MLINTMYICLLVLDEILSNLKMTKLTSDAQRCVTVKVLCVDLGASFDKSLYNGQLAATHRKMQRCVFVGANAVDVGVELFIVFKIFILLI